jgi:2-polyprenyl-3-methyl-5-hydroxy-6-metoxy-1,4-benzoquinol methylase
MSFDGDQYQARFDALAAQGRDVHGEATFVRSLRPRTVLDAGCGTGRVAIELARHGIKVVAVDNSTSMIATARARAHELDFRQADLTALDLHEEFDVVVMAGNVPLFAEPGTQRALVAGCARHLEPHGALVAGFQLDRGYGLHDYDADCAEAGLEVVERFGTWDREPMHLGGSYAVSIHRPSS